MIYIHRLKNNLVIKNPHNLGIYITKDGNLVIPIFALTAILKFILFRKFVDYKTVQMVVNEYKECELERS